MKKIGRMLALVMLVILFVVLVVGCGGQNTSSTNSETKEESTDKKEEVKRISLATGGTAGTYYPVGSGITAIITKYVDDIEATAESTGASVANLKMIRDGKIDMILAASNTAYAAYSGEQPFDDKPVGNIRGIAALYPEIFQFVVLKDSGLEKVSDLKGKKVAVGAPGSGTERTAKMLLKAHGITYDDIEPQFLKFGEAITALKDRLIDCAIIGSGIPTSAVVDASASLDINLLEVDKDVMDEFLKKVNFMRLETIPEGTYNGVNKDVLTIASPALLITHEKMDDEMVYGITKALFEHIDELERVHAQGKNIKLENALKAMSIPLHPGAEKYYKEVGLFVD